MSATSRLALYTTVYPQMRAYFADWYASFKAQTDRDVDIWIGLDRMTAGEVWDLAGEHFAFTPVAAEPGLSVAGLRQKAFSLMAERYFGVIFTDADDWMMPERVAQARSDLLAWDASACAMRIVSTEGRDLGQVFTAAPGTPLEDNLVERNVFGLSNTAYRCELLRQILPIPAHIILVDWLLATRAWLRGARLRFNPSVLMAYRQYEQNTARVLPPFSAQQILHGTRLALDHYDLFLETDEWLPEVGLGKLEAARRRARHFEQVLLADPQRLEAYTAAINQLTPDHVWWSFVAHPRLERIFGGENL